MRRFVGSQRSAESRLRTTALLALGLLGCGPGLVPVATVAVRLPGGVVQLGSSTVCTDDTGPLCGGDHPPHPVALSPFFLDGTEVSRLQYGACVVAGGCAGDADQSFDYPDRDLPQTVDDAASAAAYCAFQGMRLPTEAEFEYAARLGGDGALHDYPWGDTAPTCDQVAHAGCAGTAPGAVGSNTTDVTAAGIHDLAGSVPEWVADDYSALAGCADQLGYGDLCDDDASCAAARCTADGALCGGGCLPASDDPSSSASGATTPLCPRVRAGAAPVADPVMHAAATDEKVTQSVRGGGAADRLCALAGYTRRHASKGFSAGFRCARSVSSGNTPAPPFGYRFRLAGCPSDGDSVEVKAKVTGGASAPFDLDYYPGSPGAMTARRDFQGSVDALGCAGTFVVRPRVRDSIDVFVAGADGCSGWSRTVSPSLVSPTQSPRVEQVALAGAASCRVSHAAAACQTRCTISQCDPGYADCDASFTDGCEVSTASDAANCGGCGNACATLANTTLACIDGACAVATCGGRYADCDQLPANGCEADLAGDAANCGACRRACSPNNILHTRCDSGVCDGDCEPGTADCNGDKLSDGCEVRIATDPTQCGTCGHACSTNNLAEVLCQSGECSGPCLPNFADCNLDKRSDGCEVSLLDDNQHCGACSVACATGTTCQSGACR